MLVCRPFQAAIKAKFAAWTAAEIQAQMHAGVQPEQIHIPHCIKDLRDVSVGWILEGFARLEELVDEGLLTKAYRNAGTLKVITMTPLSDVTHHDCVQRSFQLHRSSLVIKKGAVYPLEAWAYI